MKYLFLDESGDHSLTRIDPQYPVFVLGGVIVDADYATAELTKSVERFKTDVLGTADVTLHTADIVRTRGAFRVLRDEALRQRFYSGLNTIMRELDYKVVACAIRKGAHLAAYGPAALDPYMLSMNVLVERFCFEIADAGDTRGQIIAEKRGSTFDAALELAWTSLGMSGTAYLPSSLIRQRVVDLHLRTKRSRIAGLELADLVVSPIGRFVAGLPPREDFAIVREKLRRRDGEYLGPGLVILPKE
jgi:hypothetical protein